MNSENNKLRVVVDTNVFISGLNFIGKPRELLELFIKGEIEVFISLFILGEIERILREKFKWDEEQIRKALKLIKEKAIVVEPKTKISVIKEKKEDNRILECAVEGRVDYLISGDRRHILPLKEFKGIKILSPSEFLRILLSRVSQSSLF